MPASDDHSAGFDAGGRRHLYGRRTGHALRAGRAETLARLGPSLAVPGVVRRAADEPPGRVDLDALFPGASDVWLEIGFGGGEHLIETAHANPSVGLIGCEHYVDGVAKLLGAVEREGLRTIRVHAHDARDLIDALPEGRLGRVFLLYPDPWPKARHHKRRFMSAANLAALARVMRPGAELRVASDIPDYIRHSLALVVGPAAPAKARFEWTARRARDWLEPWEGWPGTRYEAKALAEGRRPAYLVFGGR